MRLAGAIAVGIAAFMLLTATAFAQSFVEGTHYWFEPAVFPGDHAPKDHPRGPDKARGLVIWNGGYDSSKMALEKVPPIVQYFAEAGWDAYNLRRHTNVIGGQVPVVMLHSIERARAMGYRRILLFGQSRGAFASIQTGSYKADILGILPLAPAGFGDYGRSNDWRQNDFYIRTLWEPYKDTGIRVAAGFFTGDDWYETKQPHVRGPYAARRLTELGVPNFIIDQPAYANMQSHFGGLGWEFARRYGPCLDHFFETGRQPSCTETGRASAAVFGIRLPKAVPAADAPFTGLWQGTWKSGRFAAMAIASRAGGLRAEYLLGKGINGDKPESSAMDLVPAGEAYERPGNITFRFEMEPDDRLKVIRIDRSRPGAAENSGYFLRVAD